MPKQTTVEQELLELEQRYWQAIQDRDVRGALAMTDDPCIIAGASGVASVDHKTFTQIMEGATYELHDFAVEAPEVRMITDDVVVLAYKIREDLTVDGAPITLNAADSSVWRRTDHGWICVLHTESVLGDAYGRDRKAM